MKKGSILITGGAGYIGSHATRVFLDSGYSVVVLDDLSRGDRCLVPDSVPFFEGDIADSDLVTQIVKTHQVSALVHFAAFVSVEESVHFPDRYYQNNFIKAARLFTTCVDAGVRQIVFSSTAAVYGVGDGQPVSEQSPTDPVSPYGRSKLAAEWFLEDLSRARNFHYVCLRYFNVAGASPQWALGQLKPTSHLIKRAAEAAAGMQPEVAVYGSDYSTVDGTGVRDYIHVVDVAHAHTCAVEYLASGGKSCTLNCGYGKGHSVLEVIAAMKKVSGKNFPVRLEGRRAGDVGSLIADNSRIREVLKWTPIQEDLEVLCLSAFEWQQNAVLDLEG